MLTREPSTSIIRMIKTDHTSKTIIQKGAMLVHSEETYIEPDPLLDEDPTRPAPDGSVPVPESPSPKVCIEAEAISQPTFAAPPPTSVSATAPLGREGGGRREIGASEGMGNGMKKSMMMRSMTHKGLRRGRERVVGD
jgi:hypothetical protein